MTNTLTTSYIYPTRPTKGSLPRHDYQLFQSLGWKAQYKYNGTRTHILYTPTREIQLWTRHAERISNYTLPDFLEDQLLQIFNHYGPATILDGELLHHKHPHTSNQIAIWDIPIINGHHQIGTTYEHRYNQLPHTKEPYNFNNHNIGLKISENILKPNTLNLENTQEIWKHIDTVNSPWTNQNGTVQSPLLEGIILKDYHAKLEPQRKKATTTHGWSAQESTQAATNSKHPRISSPETTKSLEKPQGKTRTPSIPQQPNYKETKRKDQKLAIITVRGQTHHYTPANFLTGNPP